MTDKVKYYKLYTKHDHRIPEDFLSTCLKAHPEWKANRVNNVRYGKTADLQMLEEIISLTVSQKQPVTPQ
jgi:hypothetical protein